MAESKRVWILGAPDPEMAAIEQLLRECGEHVEYTTESSGERVSPRTAYSGEHVVPDVTGHVYTVECAPRLFGLIDPATGRELDAPVIWDGDVTRIDHHRPGDPGFGRGPDDFLAASSIGQVIDELARLDCLPATWVDSGWAGAGLAAPCRGSLSGPDQCGDWWCDELRIPHYLVVAAACDHCLGHAWAGRCPGVTRDDVRGYRARTAATRPVDPVEVEEYERRFAAAIETIKHAPTLQIDDCACGSGMAWHDRGSGECYDCGTPFVRVADLRSACTRHGQSDTDCGCGTQQCVTRCGYHAHGPCGVPELPDAACYLGVPYIASVTDRDGRTKTVIGGATTERCVNAFMRVWGPAQKLTGIYGDPARGFAGGYEVAS